jgi:hypothetical protein
MTTTAVFDGALAGAMMAFTSGRAYTNSDPAVAPATTFANAANAFALQFLTANTALTTPMADATTNAALVCMAAAYGELAGRVQVSTTSTDYATAATAAVANAKATLLKLT